MRPTKLILLLATCLLPTFLYAEQAPDEPATAQASIDALEQRLALSEDQRAQLTEQLQGQSTERESAQLQRLRQDNQRLKLQLKTAQAQTPPPLISERQQWFAVGAGSGLLGVIIGAILRGSRRSRREWTN
ncbi:translation initiation factor 2 [Pseudomonas sp. M30-35]|uniref:translation initiation factor 2 n=1 Tax=Pseudomonas sp. M30-35 TaxID=1981174 RepID=UPI000B3C94BD|nr:translation initiation factor 2 [Pseudomonas sp. M30-35]ARU88026.1 translation initiation factor 2 [Pseudomonas sp. M30-35]